MNQRCVIYYEKRLHGNRAASQIDTEPAGWTENTKPCPLTLSLVFSPPMYVFLTPVHLLNLSDMKVTLLALV